MPSGQTQELAERGDGSLSSEQTPLLSDDAKDVPYSHLKGYGWYLVGGLLGLAVVVGALVLANQLLPKTQVRGPTLALANANDLWAIHDLLLIGEAAIFMLPASPGRAQVQKSSRNFARLVAVLHPYETCRTRLSEALGPYPGPWATQALERSSVVQAAEVAWGCLPAKFKADKFDTNFSAQALDSWELAKAARNPILKDSSVLGVCRDSAWARTCSYWASLHAMAARADLLSLSGEFLDAVFPILAGGATLCGGCTRHLKAMVGEVLQPSVVSDEGKQFCANAQCRAARLHVEKLTGCMALAGSPKYNCSSEDYTDKLQAEISDIVAFRIFLRGLYGLASRGGPRASHPATAPKMAVATTVLAVLHNIVTSTVADGFSPPGRRNLYCVTEVLLHLRLGLVPEASQLLMPPVAGFPVVPGLGEHRLISCPPK